MLRVKALVRNEVLSPRFFSFACKNIHKRSRFPLEEQHRDLLSLIMSLRYVECQEPSQRRLVLTTRFANKFNNIKEDLERLFFRLTGKPIELVFRLSAAAGSQTVLNDLESRDLILFSGGVDSISGAVEVITRSPKSVLLHVDSSKSIFGKMRKILVDEFFNSTHTYCVEARIKSRRERSFFSNTRGLLFLTAGYVISKALNSRRLVFCENGAQMLDIMLGSLAYDNAIATKNTNLEYLKAIEDLLCDFEGLRFVVDYRFMNRTKSELISEYISENLLKKSWSCYSARFRSRMCGSCWNCFITNMSVQAVGFSESPDFETNPLRDTLTSNVFLDNQRILYNMMVFYKKVINGDLEVCDEIGRYEDILRHPLDLATRFGLDLFLGMSHSLSNIKNKNGLGRKAVKLLSEIDNSLLLERKELFASSHNR